jgi:hypothetical protein
MFVMQKGDYIIPSQPLKEFSSERQRSINHMVRENLITKVLIKKQSESASKNEFNLRLLVLKK